MATDQVTDETQGRIRVLVLFGGRSSEHPISCATAAGVLATIDRTRFEPIPVGITRSGQWHLVPDNPDLFRINDGKGAHIASGGNLVTFVAGSNKLIQIAGEQVRDLGTVDVVLPLLHGAFGEDGTIQGLFEMSNVPYVGCGVLASAAAMDKHTTKTILQAAGLDVGKWVFIGPARWNESREKALEEVKEMGLPLYVKPCRAGSSMGITRVEKWNQLVAAIDEASTHDPRIIVEAATAGREIEFAALQGKGGKETRVSGAGEVRVDAADGFYDYESKYFATENVQLDIPADLPQEIVKRGQEIARQAFEALGCEGLSRIDMFYDCQRDRIVINEVNTMPGFTPFSMYSKLWEACGLNYQDLVSELLDLALERPLGLR